MSIAEHQGEYFVGRNGKEYGPYPFLVLVEAVRRGAITKEDLIWRPGWINGIRQLMSTDYIRRRNPALRVPRRLQHRQTPQINNR